VEARRLLHDFRLAADCCRSGADVCLGLFRETVAVTGFVEVLEKDEGVVGAVVQVDFGDGLELPVSLHYDLVLHPFDLLHI